MPLTLDADVRHRAETVKAAMAPTYALCAAALVYVVLTWPEPNRTPLAVLFCLGATSMAVLDRLPLEAVVRSRWCEHFFVGWSVGDLALISTAVALDGGVASPLILVFFFPLVFTSLSYPPQSIAIVYGTAVGAYVLVGLAATVDPEPAHVFMGAAAIGLAPWIGFRQARTEGRRRRDLTLMSRTDPLTGLLNHTAFQQRLEHELAQAAAAGRQVALVALDIDHFKAVNDRLGHASGDAALRSVAAAIRGAVRPWDPCGRMGGDEFLIALPGVDIERAERVAARVRAAACDSSVEITVSAGIAVFPDHARGQEELMGHADAALYRSKREGRDRTVAYAPAG